MKHTGCLLLALAMGAAGAVAQTRSATLTLDFAKDAGPMEMNHVSLGQGGLSRTPSGIAASPRYARCTHA